MDRRVALTLLATTGLCLGLASPTSAQTLKDQLIGTWTLISNVRCCAETFAACSVVLSSALRRSRKEEQKSLSPIKSTAGSAPANSKEATMF